MNPGAPSVQFESQSLQERLRAIIQSESETETEAESEAESEAETEPEAVPEPKTPKKSKKAEVTPVPDAPMKAKPEPKTPKKAVKKLELELEPVAPPAPIKVPKSASIEERMALILSEEPEEEEEEPESPGAVRHRLIMAEKGLPVEYDDDEMTEDEFDEEDLLE
jgi:uncharacterized protein (DUF1800 family)